MNDELLVWIASGDARKWREAARLTQAAAAAEVEVSWNTLAAWERPAKPGQARRKPTGHNAQRYYTRLKMWRHQASRAAPGPAATP